MKVPHHPAHALRWLAAIPVLAAPFSALADYKWNFPEPVTPIARDTLKIHNEFMLIITGAVRGGVRHHDLFDGQAPQEPRPSSPPSSPGPTGRLQWFWALVPFAILLFIDFVLMGIPAVHAIIDMEDTKTKADMVLKVTGMQWKWQYEYPDAGIKFVSTLATPREQIANKEAKGEHYLLEVDNPVVLPVGKKVRVLLTSTDVIHTWWVPQFGVKRDAIPGFLRETWVKIEKPGTYRGQCAELCGKDHGFMPVVVHAVPEPEYLAWLDKKKAEQAAGAAGADRAWSKDELLAKGKEVYEKQCVVCHQPNGQGMPPAFPALAGSKIVNGPLLSPDGKLIADSHVDRVHERQGGHRDAGLQEHAERCRHRRRHHLRAQRARQQQGRHDPARPDQVPALERTRP